MSKKSSSSQQNECIHDSERETKNYSSENISVKTLNQLLEDALAKDMHEIKTIKCLSLETTTRVVLKEKEILEIHDSMKGECVNNKE